MRIKTYLSIIIFACLIGGYSIEYLLGGQRSELRVLTAEHHKNHFAANDFIHLKHNVSQLLVSVDLILGSRETYLLSGALEQTGLLIEQLNKLSGSAPIFKSTEVLALVNSEVLEIQKILNEANSSKNLFDEPEELNDRLKRYDALSILLVSNIELLSKLITAELEEEELELEKLRNYSERVEKISLLAFLVLILVLWYWGNRKISLPLRKLSDMAANVNKTGRFDGINKGTEEVMMLSNELSILTNSLLHKANHDSLTDLFNRREFERQLRITFEEVRKNGNDDVNAVGYIDLDRFKVVNDTCGHAVGDELLKQVAGILVSHVRTNDVVARLGGDEFVLLLRDCSVDSAMQLGHRFLNEIEGICYKFGNKEFNISASIGITVITGGEENIHEVINAADSACAIAKESGRNQVQVLKTDDKRVDHKRRELLHLNEIINAIDESRLVLFFQNIVPLQEHFTNRKHYEVLVRLQTEDKQLVTPVHFLPIIERYQLSTRLDKWVVNEVITQLSRYPEALEQLEVCSINLSGQSLNNKSFLDFVIDLLEENSFPGNKLCFEITETAAISDIEHAMYFIKELKKIDVCFALDDFGTGHSSFEYLKNLPVDYIKIDGSFVKDMLEDVADLATVKSITEVGKATGKKVVAEFVHSKEIARHLRVIGVDYAQGYYFMEPAELKMDCDTSDANAVNY